MSETQIRGLKTCVYRLNQSLFDALNDTKKRKFDTLVPPNVESCGNVVTIPENLTLNSHERKVLGK